MNIHEYIRSLRMVLLEQRVFASVLFANTSTVLIYVLFVKQNAKRSEHQTLVSTTTVL